MKPAKGQVWYDPRSGVLGCVSEALGNVIFLTHHFTKNTQSSYIYMLEEWPLNVVYVGRYD